MTPTKTGEQKEARGKILRGVVVSNKAKDTVTVLVTRYVKHPKYQKYQKRTKKYLAHDLGNTKELGAAVSIRETRPISKRKSFIVI